MRKRVLIGVIAAVVIGVAVLGYSLYVQRRENSIEYHKAEYIAARDGRPTPVRLFWAKITGQKPQHRMSFEKLHRHDEALRRLGYWREQMFVISNRPMATVLGIACKHGAHLWWPELTKEVCVVAPVGTNTIVVRAVPEHMPIWAGLIRDADVPWGK